MRFIFDTVVTFEAVVAGVALASAVMVALWFVQRHTANAGIVDAGWTFEVAGLSVYFAALGPGWPPRRLAVGTMMALWGIRLGLYLVRDRLVGRPEDGRYRALRERWGARANVRFFWFFQAQALAAVFFAAPAMLVAANTAEGFSMLEGAALAIWMAALAGEALADRQLERFKGRPDSRGRTCRDGLWRYSRHPNYFFEWLAWVALAMLASAGPWGWLAWLCPAVMLYLLFNVTGIPETEAQAVRTRGEDYRRYQRTTSVFVPWFPGGL